MIDLNGLNAPQHDAASTIEGPIMILAGAGTGKTRVISYRIAHMVSQGIKPSSIVALTFTNKAAREMNERVKSLCPEVKKLNIGTFHSFCLSMLRTKSKEANLDRDFSLVGTSEQLDMVRAALEEKGWSGLFKPEEFLTRISNAKTNLLSPSDLLSGVQNPYFYDDDPTVLAYIYDLYMRQLKLNHAIDFDDCIYLTWKMLKEHNEVRIYFSEKFRYFLVDEFQDTNFSQLAILELLAQGHGNICVVGDDDQSIYSWRGAMIETLEKFESTFKNTKLIKLEQNYRCTNIILNAANTIIKNNKIRKDKTLWSTSNSETPIVISAQEDDGEEAKWIAQKIFAALGQGYQPKDIGILYRANAQARPLEVALREMNIAHKIFGGTSFFEKKEVKDFLSYFRLIVNNTDRLSFWRVINYPSRGIGLKTKEHIEEQSKSANSAPFEIIDQASTLFKGKTQATLSDFHGKIKSLSCRPVKTGDDIYQLGIDIIKVFRLENDIKEKTSHEKARERKMDSLRRLPLWLKTVAEKFSENAELNIVELLDKLTLSDDGAKNTDNEEENLVSLMTIHASKGLEFPIVFVCGVEEEQLPHKNSLESDESICEERRLFYVAITRAKEQLTLSWAKERFSSFQKQRRKPSRFLIELPTEGIVTDEEITGSAITTTEDRKKRNLSRLNGLKSMIKEGFHRN